MTQDQQLKAVIGLEIHVQLKTLSKMFCSCPNDPEETLPNSNICPICLAHPGTLPTANAAAVEKVAKVGLAVNCQIPTETEFARKSYFYPDLPKGYQISQADKPLCIEGFLDINRGRIRIRRIHLEEDTGRLAHEKGGHTLVDFNRAGVPLMELVTEPDFQNGEEVAEFAKELQLILRCLGVSDADMEKGEMRVEANVSVQPPDQPMASGTKTELKNINSLRAVREAIDYELIRQRDMIGRGEKVVQETRGWDGQKTFLQRKKEEEQEYRYFPEPDLLPIRWEKSEIEEIRQGLPELPAAKRQRFVEEYGLKAEDVEVLVRDIPLGNYFEKAASELAAWMKDENIPADKSEKLTQSLANYLITDLKGMMGEEPWANNKVTPENLAELVVLIHQGKLSSRMAKDVLQEMFVGGGDPSQIMADRGISKIDDEKMLVPMVQKILAEHPKACQDFAKGKTSAVQFLIGQLMRETKGAVDPDTARRLLEQELSKL